MKRNIDYPLVIDGFGRLYVCRNRQKQKAHLILKLQIGSVRSLFVHCSLTFFCS